MLTEINFEIEFTQLQLHSVETKHPSARGGGFIIVILCSNGYGVPHPHMRLIKINNVKTGTMSSL